MHTHTSPHAKASVITPDLTQDCSFFGVWYRMSMGILKIWKINPLILAKVINAKNAIC